TLPTGRINALAIEVPHKKNYILAFEVGLIQLIIYLSDFAAAHLQPATTHAKGSTQFTIAEEMNKAKIQDLVQFLFSYYQTGIPSSSGYEFLQNNHQRMVSQGLRNITKLFIVGHEYAHIGLKHLENGERQFMSLLNHDDCLISTTETFQQEHEADQVGFLISLVAYLKKGLPYWFSGATIIYFLKFSEYIYQGISLILEKEIKDMSHPPIIKRIDFLESVLAELIPQEEYQNYYGLRHFYYSLIDEFEKAFFKEIDVQRKQIKVAPIWEKFMVKS
ncbi:MAG: hypothetical protein KDD99_27530, partial [Bacteroidetes bacterium]|nr:hypothetical protein [Bacteroidota bacterium]